MPVTAFTPPEVPTAAPLHVELIDDVQGFTALRSQWNSLLHASGADCPFLTWEWLHTWWTHLSGARDLRLLALRAGDQLVGLAPLSLTRASLPWLSRLEFLGTGWAGSDYLDLIARRTFESECVGTSARWLQSRGLALQLDHLPAPHSLSASLAGRLTGSGWTSLVSGAASCPFTKLLGHSWESYLETLAPSHRTRVRRYLNSLHKTFNVRFERVTTELERQHVLDALISFHDERWADRGGSTAFQTPALRAFHHDVTRQALEGGWLRLYALRLNDTLAAAVYCFAYNSRFYLYQHGFNQQFRKHSVGLVILGLAIRAAIDERALEFDMLYGSEPYKWLWARDARRLNRIDLFPAHIGGKLHHRTVEAERTMRTLARRIFPRKPCNSTVPPAGVAC